MDDVIRKQTVLNMIDDVQFGNITNKLTMLHEAVRNLTPVDAVEVIRCKDCRFHEDEQPGMVYCPAVVGGWVEDDWFCKGGERKTDG